MAQLQGGMSGGPRNLPNRVQPTDPLAELKALLEQSGVGASGADIDYQAQARNAYAPSFGYLDQAGKNAQGQAGEADIMLNRLYGGLSKDILGQEKGIRRQYDTGVKSTNSAYQDALRQIAGRFSNTKNESADILERLGIQEAGNNVVNKSDEAQRLIEGIMGANRLGSVNALNEGKQASVTYNKQQGSAAKFAGAEARKGVQSQLQNFLQGLEAKRAELGSQVNQYGLSLAGDAASRQASAGGDIFDRLFKLKQFEYDMAKDKADYDLKVSQTTGDTSKMDPLGEVQQLATQLYPNEQAAANAVRVVLGQAMQMGGEPPNLETLMQSIQSHLMERNGRVGDLAQLQRLAALYMQNRG